jgi:hypothetical protein
LGVSLQNILKFQKGVFMSKRNDDDFFTKHHARLTNFALAANIVAWIVFIAHIILVCAKYIETQNIYNYQSMVSGQIADFADMLKEKPIYAASFYVNLFGIFLDGIVYALVLKGISLGLYIILENDLNKKGADDDDSTPVFYKPQDVLWLEKWINKSIIAVIGYTVVVSLFTFSKMKEIALTYFINQPNADLSASIVTGVLIVLNILFASALYYFMLKSLSSALIILMETEHNSRRSKR